MVLLDDERSGVVSLTNMFRLTSCFQSCRSHFGSSRRCLPWLWLASVDLQEVFQG